MMLLKKELVPSSRLESKPSKEKQQTGLSLES
jgi:hypothetical protein